MIATVLWLGCLNDMKFIKYIYSIFPRNLWIVLILINVVAIFAFILSSSSDAVSYTPYQSVDNNNNTVNNLVNTLISQEDYDSFKDWYCFCNGQDDYILAYNIEGLSAKILHLYSVDSSLTFEKYSEDSFSFTPNSFTIVGNVDGALGSSIASKQHDNFIGTLSIVSILVVVLFFVFRSRKRAKNTLSL